MIDRGFVISDELQKLCVVLDIPCEAFIEALFSTTILPQKLWRRGVVAFTTAQLHSQSLNSGSAQVQILLAVCRRFEVVRIPDNGPGWK